MVTYRDVAKRHVLYGTAFALVLTISKFAWTLAGLLSVLLAATAWHHSTPLRFVALTSLATPVVTGMLVKGSEHTWWYATPIDFLGVPPWLFPMHGMLAHWVLDAYFMVTLSEVRKITLP